MGEDLPKTNRPTCISENHLLYIYTQQFLPRDALLSVVYAVVVCLCVCVCVSVCHTPPTPVLYQNG